MKILAINGSPRGTGHNTYIMVEEFLKGARKAGAETEHILLAGKKINHCIGCFTCWTKTPGVCVFKDDMTELLEKMSGKFDALVLATPLYVDNISGLLKNFLDRSIPTADPHFSKDRNGESVHMMREDEKGRKLIAIANCGFPEQTHFEVLKVLFRRMARNFHAELAGEIYRGEGELLKSKSLLLLPILYRYKKLLQRCGKEFVEQGRFSDESKASLEKPLIPYDFYLKQGNKYWDKELSK